jgi:hypothetical protein
MDRRLFLKVMGAGMGGVCYPRLFRDSRGRKRRE